VFRLTDSEPDWLRVGVFLLAVGLVALAALYALVRSSCALSHANLQACRTGRIGPAPSGATKVVSV
jgi:hypothetical protein